MPANAAYTYADANESTSIDDGLCSVFAWFYTARLLTITGDDELLTMDVVANVGRTVCLATEKCF